jgi:hypothetical protein
MRKPNTRAKLGLISWLGFVGVSEVVNAMVLDLTPIFLTQIFVACPPQTKWR